MYKKFKPNEKNDFLIVAKLQEYGQFCIAPTSLDNKVLSIRCLAQEITNFWR